MVIRVRHRPATTVLVAVVLLAACSRGETDRVEATLDEVWRQRSPVVEVTAPAPMLLPGPDAPRDTTLTSLDLPEEEQLPSPMSRELSAQTLWADPERDDPMTGPMLLVGRTSLDDTHVQSSLKLPLEGRPVDIGRSDAVLGRQGPLIVVTWPLPIPASSSCACTQMAVVAGRQLSDEAVLAAARSARPLAQRPSVASDGLPVGLRFLGTLPGLSHEYRWQPIVQRTEVLVAGAIVELRVFEGDPRLIPHLQFWSAGRRDLFLHASAAGRQVVVVDQRSEAEPAQRDLEALLDSLRAVTETDMMAAQRRARVRPTDAADRCDERPETTASAATFAGGGRGGRWTVTIGLGDGRSYRYCSAVDHGTGFGGSGGGSYLEPLSSPEQVRIIGTSEDTSPEGDLLVVAFGDVPAAASRVQASIAGRAPIDAQVADTGPGRDRRWFAVADEPPDDLTAVDITVVAFDGEGREIARTTNDGS